MDFASVLIFQTNQTAFAAAIAQAFPLTIAHISEFDVHPKGHFLGLTNFAAIST